MIKSIFSLIFALILLFAAGCRGYRMPDNFPEKLDIAFDVETLSGSVFYPENGKSIAFKVNSRSITLDGTLLYLNQPVLFEGGQLKISGEDINSIFTVLLLPDQIELPQIKTIVLDPGHGGSDSGAKGQLFLEKAINLAIANVIKAKLEQAGFTILLTRTGDQTMSLADRSEFAKKAKADLFLSLHQNSAGGSQKQTGIETFILTTPSSNSTHGQENALSEPIILPGNANDRENTLLAYQLHKSVIAATGAVDRGVKHARFKVLNLAPCPAMLFEFGFISTRQEEPTLMDPVRQEKIAAAIAEALQPYLKK